MTPRDRIWAAVRLFRSGPEAISFSVAEVMLMSGQRADTALSYLAGLEKAGFVARALGQSGARLHRRELRLMVLKRDIGIDAPRVGADGKPVTQGVGRERIWNAVRKQSGPFTWREVALHASTEDRPVAMDEVKTYLKFLVRAGYVRTMTPGAPRIPAKHLFVRSRDTGPRAPIVCRDKSVQDGNTGEIVLAAAGKAGA